MFTSMCILCAAIVLLLMAPFFIFVLPLPFDPTHYRSEFTLNGVICVMALLALALIALGVLWLGGSTITK